MVTTPETSKTRWRNLIITRFSFEIIIKNLDFKSALIKITDGRRFGWRYNNRIKRQNPIYSAYWRRLGKRKKNKQALVLDWRFNGRKGKLKTGSLIDFFPSFAPPCLDNFKFLSEQTPTSCPSRLVERESPLNGNLFGQHWAAEQTREEKLRVSLAGSITGWINTKLAVSCIKILCSIETLQK